MIRLLVLCAMLAGCAGGVVRHTLHEGEVVVEHVDTRDQPYPCTSGVASGCSQMRGTIRHIWYSSVGPAYVLKHELAHKIMEHSEWEYNQWYEANCATITVGATDYPLGHLLCNNGKTEWTIAP